MDIAINWLSGLGLCAVGVAATIWWGSGGKIWAIWVAAGGFILCIIAGALQTQGSILKDVTTSTDAVAKPAPPAPPQEGGQGGQGGSAKQRSAAMELPLVERVALSTAILCGTPPRNQVTKWRWKLRASLLTQN